MDAAELRELRDRVEASAYFRARSGFLYGLLGYVLVGGLMLMYYGNTSGEDFDQRNPVIITMGWAIVVVAVVGNLAMVVAWRRFQQELRRWVDAMVRLDPERTPQERAEYLTRGHGRSGPSPGSAFVLGGLMLPPFGTIAPAMTLMVVWIALGDPHRRADVIQLSVAFVAAVTCSLLLVLVPGGQWWQGRRLIAWRRTATDTRLPRQPQP